VIRGSVREASEPVAGAVVSFVAGPTALPDIATLTDPSGDFSLSAPISGRYAVAVVFPDGHQVRHDVDIADDEDVVAVLITR
jgi:Carboxypeptidase regulatory-like domain